MKTHTEIRSALMLAFFAALFSFLSGVLLTQRDWPPMVICVVASLLFFTVLLIGPSDDLREKWRKEEISKLTERLERLR